MRPKMIRSESPLTNQFQAVATTARYTEFNLKEADSAARIIYWPFAILLDA